MSYAQRCMKPRIRLMGGKWHVITAHHPGCLRCWRAFHMASDFANWMQCKLLLKFCADRDAAANRTR